MSEREEVAQVIQEFTMRETDFCLAVADAILERLGRTPR